MSDSGFGSNSKGGTVYSGPSPVGTTGTIYGTTTAPLPPSGGAVPGVGGTVYGGPSSVGTVYNGAPAGPAAARPTSGNQAGNVGARKAARIFYVIGGVTVLKTILVFFGVQQLNATISQDRLQQALIIDLVVAGIFALIGVFTQNGSKIALVIGMLLYGADMALVLFTDPASHIVYLAVHGFLLFLLVKAYTQFFG